MKKEAAGLRSAVDALCRFFPSAGGRVKTWKRRWFILTDNCLYYFEYTTVSARDTLSLLLPHAAAEWPGDEWARKALR